jgi:predicted phage-related endonuclease
MSHPDRNTYIGAYDICSIIGVNPYCSVEEMAMRKLGMIDAVEVNEAMEMGLLFEDAILNRAEKELGKIDFRGRFIQHPSIEYLGGTIDGIAGDTLIDAKNLNYFSMKEWEENGVPEVYIVQLNYYAALLNALGEPVYSAKLAVVFGGQTFRIFDVPIDKELGDILIQKAVDFWNRFIVNKESLNLAQAPVGLLEKYYSKSNGTEIALNDDHIGFALREYIRIREEIKERDEALKRNKAIIEAAMAEASKAVWTNGNEAIAVSWGNTTKKSFDTTLFKSENPELYDKYMHETTYRVMRVTEKNLTKKIKGGE